MGPSIETKKLKEYIASNSSYHLYQNDDKVEVHFSPEFPEAMAHLPEGKYVEHIMYGVEKGSRIYFYRFSTVSASGTSSTELKDKDDPIMEGLKYI